MKGKSLKSSIFWISCISKRFSRVDRKGRSAATSILATLGIGFGVMTLIVVMSVMNGFQMSFIDSILEISSYHVRVENLSENKEIVLKQNAESNKKIKSVTPFYESQALMTGNSGGANSVIIRAVDKNIREKDEGFNKETIMISGQFLSDEENSIVLGYTLARNLGVRVGDTVNLLVMSGGSDVELFSNDRLFTVAGTFVCGYSEINSSYAFINIDYAENVMGESAKKCWGVKLSKQSDDMRVIYDLEKELPESKIRFWRDFNKSFFGTLKVEKNMLLLLVALIFVVVAINIYNGMRRLVFERKSEIAILSALGARNNEIKFIFIVRGFLTGAIGAVFGVIFGLIISYNTDVVFKLAAKILYWGQYFITFITNPQNLAFVQENSSYNLYASIPARVFPSEVIAIALFGILSPLAASFAASKNVLKMTVSEVLHNE